MLKSKYAVKKTEQLGSETAENDEEQVRVDKQESFCGDRERKVKLSKQSEADNPYAEMFVKQLGRDNAKTVDVPESKPTKEELDERAKNKIRSINRVDLDTVVKILDKNDGKNWAKTMQTPKECDMQRLKRSC